MADQKTEDTKSPLQRRSARPFAGPAGAARPFLRPVTTPQRATAAPFVPPVVPDFMGELKCIEVDDSGAPLAGNHFKGEAILVRDADGDISGYNAIAVLG